MDFSKEHLSAANNYSWTDELEFTGTPSRRLFDRHNGNQLLFIIKNYASQAEEFSPDHVSKIENLILHQLPLEVKSEISVLKWLQENQKV